MYLIILLFYESKDISNNFGNLGVFSYLIETKFYLVTYH